MTRIVGRVTYELGSEETDGRPGEGYCQHRKKKEWKAVLPEKGEKAGIFYKFILHLLV